MGQSRIFEFIDEAKKMIRPANYPEGTPGNGIAYIKVNQLELAVINLIGRVFMSDVDDPFRKADELVEEASQRTPLILLTFTLKRLVKNKQWDGT